MTNTMNKIFLITTKILIMLVLGSKIVLTLHFLDRGNQTFVVVEVVEEEIRFQGGYFILSTFAYLLLSGN